MDIQQVQKLAASIKENILKVIVGKDEQIEILLSALFAGGHVLLEDVPGTGKTTLARALAASMEGNFSRIQFTPDLLPSDVTGMSVFNPKDASFEFKEGPVFANIVLADEINRATPRSQSAMLECMEEKQVSYDGKTYHLNLPFFVIATQNPIETQGTFPLPEAQLDRFFVRLALGYPSAEEQKRILQRFIVDSPEQDLSPVCKTGDVLDAQQAIKGVQVHGDVMGYIGAICEKTRELDQVILGASPRAALTLMRVSQAFAAIKGRDFVTAEDVRLMAAPVLSHRLVLRTAFGASGQAAAAVQEALESTAAPTEALPQGA